MASIDSRLALSTLVAQADLSGEDWPVDHKLGPPETRTERGWSMEDLSHLEDGMWHRPEGFPPLEGTPPAFRPDIAISAS